MLLNPILTNEADFVNNTRFMVEEFFTMPIWWPLNQQIFVAQQSGVIFRQQQLFLFALNMKWKFYMTRKHEIYVWYDSYNLFLHSRFMKGKI